MQSPGIGNQQEKRSHLSCGEPLCSNSQAFTRFSSYMNKKWAYPLDYTTKKSQVETCSSEESRVSLLRIGWQDTRGSWHENLSGQNLSWLGSLDSQEPIQGLQVHIWADEMTPREANILRQRVHGNIKDIPLREVFPSRKKKKLLNWRNRLLKGNQAEDIYVRAL